MRSRDYGSNGLVDFKCLNKRDCVFRLPPQAGHLTESAQKNVTYSAIEKREHVTPPQMRISTKYERTQINSLRRRLHYKADVQCSFSTTSRGTRKCC